MKIASIILAAGKGTRMQTTEKNKVAFLFHGKALVTYAVELFVGICDPIIVVVGTYSESVRAVLTGYQVQFVDQVEQLGTGDAVKVGVDFLKKSSSPPNYVIVSYGDHSMFYRKETVKKLIKLHSDSNSAISLFTTVVDNSNALAWGRIIRNSRGLVEKIVEQKEATLEEAKLNEVNPGFYCFDYDFLDRAIRLIKPSPVKKELYLTDIIQIAVSEGKKVTALPIPFEEVGIGINKPEELSISQRLYEERSQES